MTRLPRPSTARIPRTFLDGLNDIEGNDLKVVASIGMLSNATNDECSSPSMVLIPNAGAKMSILSQVEEDIPFRIGLGRQDWWGWIFEFMRVSRTS